MAPHKFDATIVFMAVAGEEQGLSARRTSPRWRRQQQTEHRRRCSRTTSSAARSAATASATATRCALFAEGVPSDETPKKRRATRPELGGENDSPSRELARFIVKTAREQRCPTFTSSSIYRRDRYLRGGDHIPFLERGYRRRPLHRAERELRPSAPERARRERRRSIGDLPQFVDFGYIARSRA